MTDAPNTPPADQGAAPPTGGTPPVADSAPPPAATKPDFLPADYWDDKSGAIKTDEFGKHYQEVSTSAAKLAERMAAVPAKPEEYKIEVKLPDGVKPPDGVTFDPSKDPRLPALLKTAHQLGLSNTEVNRIVALDAELALAEHTAETARIAEETKKLGEKATDRIAAVTNWAKGLKDKGDLTAEEHAEIRAIASSAAGVSLLEKLSAKANGGIPGHQPSPPPSAQPKTVAERLYPHLPSGLPPASARSA